MNHHVSNKGNGASIMQAIDGLFERQLSAWKTAKDNYAALGQVKVKELTVDNAHFKVQFNPARIISSAAKVDPKSIKERKCFLCEANRPAEQEGIEWGDEYVILINPFPIFPRHLTIPCKAHTPQRIIDRIGDMMAIASDLDGFELFYNGPKCGASAPDHMHFQAGNKGFMTISDDLRHARLKAITTVGDARLETVNGLGRSAYLITSGSVASGAELFRRLYAALPIEAGEDEPMLNIICSKNGDSIQTIVFPRIKHRPSCYYAEGEGNLLITPASVDMGGVFITPLEKDFNKVTSGHIKMILDEVCMSGVKQMLTLARME